jgi:hypothetical protein
MIKLVVKKSVALVSVAGLAFLATGQAGSQVVRRAPVTTETNVRAAKAPYTAEYKTTRVQTLADGTTITQETTEARALDSQGRQMLATTTTPADRAPTTHVMVFDPVARTQTHWTSPGKVAHVFQLPAAGEHCQTFTRDDVPVISRPKSKLTSETLGTEEIQGIEARGRRYVTTVPAGADGNDAPLVSTTERWTAVTVGLSGLVVRETRDDPQRGKTTQELTSLMQTEPDPATFQPPDGYEIVTKDSSGCQDAPPAETTGGRTTSK